MSANSRKRPPLPVGEKVVAVVGGAIVVGDRCLVARRNPGGSAGGKWEFPGGKVEPNESAEEALRREIREELGCDVDVNEWIGRGVSEPDHRLIVLDVYRCTLIGEEPEGPGHAHDSIRWCNSTTLQTLDWAPADVPILPLVASLLSATPGTTQGNHMASSVKSRLGRGASAVLRGISAIYKDKTVLKTYRFLLLGLFALSLIIYALGGYAVFHFTKPASDASTLIVWGLLLLRFVGGIGVLLVSPLIAITTCNLLFPVFSEIPFFAGMKSLDRARGQKLEELAGLGTARAIANSLRRFTLFVLISSGLFVFGFVPIVGPIVTPPLQLYFTARTVGWELLDPYFDRLRLTTAEQKTVIRKYSVEILGMGLVCAPLLAIPFVGPLLFGLIQAGASEFVLQIFPQSDTKQDLLTSRT